MKQSVKKTSDAFIDRRIIMAFADNVYRVKNRWKREASAGNGNAAIKMKAFRKWKKHLSHKAAFERLTEEAASSADYAESCEGRNNNVNKRTRSHGDWSRETLASVTEEPRNAEPAEREGTDSTPAGWILWKRRYGYNLIHEEQRHSTVKYVLAAKAKIKTRLRNMRNR
jgi:hypothetical protein